ncbi:MAG TPA: GNAT family N-acetyltransferase [Burkholderiales bacterium]|nr:GNAT family N-acetyltransferase [Burkholderiales bacterium]
MDIQIHRAEVADADEIAGLVGELLSEIMASVNTASFHFDLAATADRLKDFLLQGKYIVFVARDAAAATIGFVTVYESYALYAEGVFGTLAELYVRPGFRSGNIGSGLLSQVRQYALSRNWTRLEVTTPPLPQFDKTLRFYERYGFAVTGGRKLKLVL